MLPAGFLLSQQPGRGAETRSGGQSERKPSHSYADITKPLHVGDSTFTYHKGNVIIYHDGAVITCDSAVRYGDNRMECFKRVVINRGTTYIYGDRAEYDKDRNMARVYAPIVKVVDGDATLYTRNFTFDLATNIGRYFGGGTMKQADNYMESSEGYYYADSSWMIGVGAVEMRNPDYQLRSDSVVYNMDTEVASFWTRTYIWNVKGEILSAMKGAYHNKTKDYKFRSQAYVLTKDQEVWADSMDYNTVGENAQMRGNIQMRDDDNGIMAFGDYGEYWGIPQNGMLTRNPSLLSYDKEKGDTVYMRSDSMFLYSYDRSLALYKPRTKEAVAASGEELIKPGSGRHSEHAPEVPDTLSDEPPVDSLAVAPADSTLSPKEIKRLEKEKEKQAEQAERNKKIRARLEARAKKEEDRRQKQAEREAAALARRNARRGIVTVPADSTTVAAVDSLPKTVPPDSLALAADSLHSPAESKDSLQRVFYAYRNVRIYRRDFQAVCDSLVGFSKDSTMHMYVEPVLWEGNNQMTAAVIDLYTKNQQLDRAFFWDEPMMVSEVEADDKYNQVKGRTMEAFFRDNEIYRHNVDGNAMTLYYMQDDKTAEYMGFMNIESANISFMIDSMQMDRIIFRTQPTYTIYPMDKIPADQPQRLQGFAWHIDRRPELETVFNRSIRESERSAYESLKQPQFPLTENILRQRDNLIRTGMMEERNDRLTPFTITIIRERFDPNYGRNPEDEVSRGGNNVIETPLPHADSLPGSGIVVPDSLGGQTTPVVPVVSDSIVPVAKPMGDSLRQPGTFINEGVVRDTILMPAATGTPMEQLKQLEKAEESKELKNAVDVPDALRVVEPADPMAIPGDTIIAVP